MTHIDVAAPDTGAIAPPPHLAAAVDAPPVPDRYLRIALATELCRMGKLDKAEAMMRPLLAQAAADHETLHVLAIIAWQRSDRLGALAQLRRVVAIEDGIAAYHGDRGHACLACGYYDEAAAAFRRMLELEPGSAQGQFGLSKALVGLHDHAGAAQALEAAIAADPAGLAALAMGLTLAQLGRPAAAVEYLQQALALRPDVGASSSRGRDGVARQCVARRGRQGGIGPVRRATAVGRGAADARLLRRCEPRFDRGAVATPRHPGSSGHGRTGGTSDLAGAVRFPVAAEAPVPPLPLTAAGCLSRYLAMFADRPTLGRSRFYPGLTQRRFHDQHGYAVVKALEDSFEAIRDEIDALDDPAFHHESEGLVSAGQWKIFHFYERGKKHEANCVRCPTITRIIESHDETIRAPAGLIYISRMVPGTHIVPHVGPANLRLRSHLGIHVPAGDCRLRIAGETRSWVEGKCVVFDDTFEHEAWNFTDLPRTVLIVDLWHPDLTPEEIAVLHGLHGYAAYETASLERYWSANAHSRRSAGAHYD